MTTTKQKTALIIGAGPAGLTAAYELLHKTDIKPIIFELSNEIGGISKTVNYKGNRIDIGGHRFFSKSDRVMEWWQNILPLQGSPSKDDVLLNISYHNKSRPIELKKGGPDPEKVDEVMLIRSRLSRIYFLRKFFNYPVSLSTETVKNLGAVRMTRIVSSYAAARAKPIKPEKTLEDLYINRFGRELYSLFFEFYTEKVWGKHPSQISPEWGAQRVKGISITAVLKHAIKGTYKKKDTSVGQKSVETSLIEQFLYPKYGPGQMWETVAKLVTKKGAELHMQHTVVGLKAKGNQITSLTVRDEKTGKTKTYDGDYVFSTMPVKELVEGLGEDVVPKDVYDIATHLPYRDFMTVGLLLNKLKITNQTDQKTVDNVVPDNWVYVQDREVKVGRFQIFNNWSPYMVKDIHKVWLGLEYFVNEGDELWNKKDKDMIDFAKGELETIGVIDPAEVVDATVLRVKKAYPAYFGTYEKMDDVSAYLNKFENLFLVGRNGMHRYNNQDHSMLTAMTAVENIIAGRTDKSNIWEVNAEQSYHEAKADHEKHEAKK